MRINASKFALLVSSLSTGLMLPVSNRRSGGCSDGLKLVANCSGCVSVLNETLLKSLIDSQCGSGGCLQGHCSSNLRSCLSSPVKISVCQEYFPDVFNTICSSSQVDTSPFPSSPLFTSSTPPKKPFSTPFPSSPLPISSTPFPSSPFLRPFSTPFPSLVLSTSSTPPQKPSSTQPNTDKNITSNDTDKNITSSSSNSTSVWTETSAPFKHEGSPSPGSDVGDRTISLETKGVTDEQQGNNEHGMGLYGLFVLPILGFFLSALVFYQKYNDSVVTIKQQLRELLDEIDGDVTNDAVLLEEAFKKLSPVSATTEVSSIRAHDDSVGNNLILNNLTVKNIDLFNASEHKWFQKKRFLPILNLLHFYMVIKVLDSFFNGSFFNLPEQSKVKAAVSKHLSLLQAIQTTEIIEIENFGEKLFDAVNDFFDGIIREFDNNQNLKDKMKRLQQINQHKASITNGTARQFVDELKSHLGVIAGYAYA